MKPIWPGSRGGLYPQAPHTTCSIITRAKQNYPYKLGLIWFQKILWLHIVLRIRISCVSGGAYTSLETRMENELSTIVVEGKSVMVPSCKWFIKKQRGLRFHNFKFIYCHIIQRFSVIAYLFPGVGSYWISDHTPHGLISSSVFSCIFATSRSYTWEL